MSGSTLKTHALALKDSTTLTIASGVVLVTQQYHVIAAQSGTSDDLDTITLDYTTLTVNSIDYRPLLCLVADSGDTITLKHGTGNIDLPDDTDVTLTDDAFLWVLYNGTTWGVTKSVPTGEVGATIPDSVGIIYVAKNGNDSNDGLTIAAAKLTIGAAITAAASDSTNGTGAVPSVTNRILVKVLDAGHYEDETSDVLTCQSYINIDARNAKLLGRLELVDNVVCHFSWIEALSDASALAGTCVRKNSGTALAYIYAELLQCKGAGLGVYNANAGQVFVRFGKLEVTGAGFGIGDDGSGPSGHVHVYGGDIYLEADSATGIAISGANSIVGTVEHILEVPAGTLTGTRGIALLTGATGEINVNVQELIADTTYEVIAGTLNLIINSMTGSAGTITGTANILRGNHVSNDDHTQYPLLAGRSGGQSLIGGTGAGEVLALESTSDATKGYIIISAGSTLLLQDSATDSPLNITERSAAPSAPGANDVYLDDGTNTASGNPGWRRYTGATWEDVSAGAGGSAAPFNYRSGLNPRKLSASTLQVGSGAVVVESTTVEKTTDTVLNLATAAHWIGGSSNEAASIWINVYSSAAGSLLLHDKLPHYPAADTGAWICEARVNQAGWDGTAGQGLNATSVVYDDGAAGDPAGEGSIVAGMYLFAYTDSGYTTGRGKGSAAAGSVASLSIALITAVDTGTNTLTLEAGHQIALQDNDYLIVVEAGPPLYRQESGTWYRWLGAIYNDSAQDLTLHYDNRAKYNVDEGADYTTSSATFVAVDSTDLSLPVLCLDGWGIQVSMFCNVKASAANQISYLNFSLDGAAYAGDDGMANYQKFDVPQQSRPIGFNVIAETLPGSHRVIMLWKTSTGTTTMYAGAGTATHDLHPQFSVHVKSR